MLKERIAVKRQLSLLKTKLNTHEEITEESIGAR